MSKSKGKVIAKHVDEELSSDNDSDEVVVTKTKKSVPAKAGNGKAIKKVVVEESSSDEDEKLIAKKTKASKAVASPKKAAVLAKAKKVAKEESSDDESVEVVKKTKKVVPAKKVPDAADSDSDEDSEEVVVTKKVAAKKPVKKAPVAESDSDEEESEEVVVKKAPETNGVKKEETAGEGHNELFVKNLGYNTTEDALWTFFGTYGTVTKVKILTNREDGRSKGIGFVEFSSNAEAKKALDDAANLSLEGRELQVNYSGQKPTAPAGGYGAQTGGYGGGQQGGYGGGAPRGGSGGDKHTCFIGNLSFKTSENQIKAFFADCGGIVDVRIAKDRDTGKIKGFAHVDFEAAEGVAAAIVKNGAELDGRQLKVDASQAKSGGAGGRGGFGGGRGGGRGGFGGGRGGGRGGFDPMARAQKSGAIMPNSGNNVMTFDD